MSLNCYIFRHFMLRLSVGQLVLQINDLQFVAKNYRSGKKCPAPLISPLVLQRGFLWKYDRLCPFRTVVL